MIYLEVVIHVPSKICSKSKMKYKRNTFNFISKTSFTRDELNQKMTNPKVATWQLNIVSSFFFLN